MATVAPIHRAGSPPDRFIEALNGLLVGIVSLDFVRRSLAAALEGDAGSAPAFQSLIDDAYHEGRLAADDYEALSLDLGRELGEDVPTEWSEQALDEASPASDTVRPGEEPAPVATHATTLYPGAVLRDRFVLQERIASSGMSEVFKALDRRRQESGADNPWLAIKVVGPGTPRFADALKLLQQEAALAQRLDHPHIVRVFDFDRDGDYAFITMEWLEGESLAQILTRQRYRPLTVAHARQILTGVGEALAFAHARGITHADVKPGNIFLTREGPAKLLDFGIARYTTDVVVGGAADARTPAYASCEVLEGEPATAQDDLYSLACVAYRMLAGRRAFGHGDALAAERAGRRPAPIRTLGLAHWPALERALQFRRTARTPDVATFLAGFNASPASAGQPVQVPKAPDANTAAEIAERPRESMRARAAVAAGVAAVAVSAWLVRDPMPGDAAPIVEAPPPVAVAAAVEPGVPAATQATIAAPVTGRTSAPEAPKKVTGDVRARAARSPLKKSSPRETPATAPAAVEEAAPMTPVAAGLVAMTETTAAAVPTAETPVAAGAASAGEPALIPAAPALANEGAVAPATTSRKLVPLTQLEFRRYVEPDVRVSSREPDAAGWVEVEFIVDAGGVPRDIAVVGSSPPGRFEAAALSAVKRWRFVPAREDGAAIERRTGVRLRFQPE